MSVDVEEHNKKTIQAFSQRIGEDLIEEIGKVLDEFGITDTGDLKSSFEVKRDGEMGVIVGTKLKQAPAIEWGRLAGSMPPIESILEWVMRKKDPSLTPEEAMEVAWRVAKKIEEEGQDATRFVRIAIVRLIARKGR